MKIKKIITLIICALILFSFSGCVNTEEDIDSAVNIIEYCKPSEITDTDKEIYNRVKGNKEFKEEVYELVFDAIEDADDEDEYEKENALTEVLSYSAAMDTLGYHDKTLKNRIDGFIASFLNKEDIDSIFEFADAFTDATENYEFEYYSGLSNFASAADVENILATKYTVAVSQKGAGYYAANTETDPKTKAIEHNHLTATYQWRTFNDYCGDFCYQSYTYQAPRFGDETFEMEQSLKKYDGSGEYMYYKGVEASGSEDLFNAILGGGTAYVCNTGSRFDIIVKVDDETYMNNIFTVHF